MSSPGRAQSTDLLWSCSARRHRSAGATLQAQARSRAAAGLSMPETRTGSAGHSPCVIGFGSALLCSALPRLPSPALPGSVCPPSLPHFLLRCDSLSAASHARPAASVAILSAPRGASGTPAPARRARQWREPRTGPRCAPGRCSCATMGAR